MCLTAISAGSGAVDKKNDRIEVNYDGRIVDYEALEMNELTLAYAISVHKSQGSEYPAVIVPIMTHHYPLLQRNLLYTAITRGEKAGGDRRNKKGASHRFEATTGRKNDCLNLARRLQAHVNPRYPVCHGDCPSVDGCS